MRVLDIDDTPFHGLEFLEAAPGGTRQQQRLPFLPYRAASPMASWAPKPSTFDLPAELEVRFDPPSGTGFAFVIEAGYFMLPIYEGTCLEVDPDAGTAQYTMELEPISDFKYLFALELVSPLGRDRLAEVGIDGGFSELGLAVDMGTHSIEDGAPVQGPGPCDAQAGE